MTKVDTLVQQMRYWCEQGNLGYDQGNRWDIRVGGECDCSSLVYWCLWEAGYLSKPTDSPWNHTLYTGTLKRDLEAAGWTAVRPNGLPEPGYVVLNEKNHVAVCTGYGGQLSMASIDERGKASGGQSGDQTDKETKTRGYYDYPWDWFLIPPDEGEAIVGGWQHDDTGWWYRHDDGSYTTDDWEQIDGYWYWFDNRGYAATGWQHIYTNRTKQQEWYYFAPSPDFSRPECAMLANTVAWIDDGWYAFNSEGQMIVDVVPVDEHGRLVLDA